MLPTRNHLLLAGLLLFCAGIQFRLVQSFTLNEKSSTFVAAMRPPHARNTTFPRPHDR